MRSRDKAFEMIEQLLQEALQGLDYARRKGLRNTARTALKETLKGGLLNDTLARVLGAEGKQFRHNWSLLARSGYPSIAPLELFRESDHGESYTSVIVDSIEGSNLIGGIRSALALGTLLANRRQQPLRIITRLEKASAETYRSLIESQCLTLDHELILIHDDPSARGLYISHNIKDLFITTSWWSTYSCLQRVDPGQILYLLQEDERQSYPNGDLRIASGEVMGNEKISFAIGSKLLWDHLICDGFHNIATKGDWFEPAIQKSSQALLQTNSSTRKKLLVYANSDIPNSLYRMGLSVINDCLTKRLFDAKKWEIIIIDHSFDQFTFDDGTTPTLVPKPTLVQYLRLVAEADIGLALMAGPQPGFPTLDLAAAGSVVVTNSYGNKTSLSCYSDRIICAEPNLEALQHAMGQAIESANTISTAETHSALNSLPISWSHSFLNILDRHS